MGLIAESSRIWGRVTWSLGRPTEQYLYAYRLGADEPDSLSTMDKQPDTKVHR